MSTTSNIQNSLFEAMKIFSDYSVSNSDATITIDGQIHEVIDEGAGQYSIEYLGNTFTAHSANNATYAVGESVYILVPEGDFGKEKIILGTTNASTDLYITNSNDLGYNEVSDNLIENSNIVNTIIQMSSYETTEKTDYNIIVDTNKDLFGKLFENYLVDYNTFKFSYSVKTSLAASQQAGGNYGVSLHIPLIAASETGGGNSSQIWKAVTLDVGNLFGDPYRLTAWSPQSVYFSIDSQYIYDTSRIPYFSYFCYGFPQDSTKADIFDILIKDISFTVAKELAEDETTGYSLSLKASQGEYFSTFYDATKTITPTLKVNGKTTSINKASIYWFKENAEIKSDSSTYLAYGGYGWECLNDKTNIAATEDGNVTFDYITNVSTLKVLESDVLSTTRYKCVVVYKGKAVSAIIKLKNLASKSYLKLIGTNGTNVFLKDTGYVDLTAIVYYEGITDNSNAENYRDYIKLSWSRYDKNGTYLNDQGTIFKTITNNVIEDECFVTRVKYPVSFVEDSNIVYCSAKYIRIETDANGNAVVIEHLIGTEEIPVLTKTEDSFNLIINGDDIIYKYDSDGDSPMGVAYDGPSTSKITSITSLTYTLRKSNGMELTEDEYAYVKYTWKIAKNSMFTISNATSSDDNNYYYIEGYGNKSALPYGIANRYNTSKAKNSSIILTVEFQDNIVTANASINFIKEGMSGSNGTAYAAELVWGGTLAAASVPYGTLTADGFAKKLKFWYNINKKILYYYDFEKKTLVDWNTSPRYIYARVWENSSELTYSTNIATNNSYTVEWSMFDSKTTNPCFEIASTYKNSRNARISLIDNSLTNSTINNVFCNIVQAKITVNGQSSIANQNEVIYVYYPIEITLTNFDSDIVPTLDGGFAEVMYASDGTNPSWDETNEFIINDNQLIDSEFIDFFNIEWSASNHLTIKDGSSSNSKIIKPNNKFDNGDSKNYVKTTLNFNSDKTSVEKLKNDAEFSKDIYENSIVEIENTRNALTSFANKWTYNNWNQTLNDIKIFLDKRTSTAYHATVLYTESLNALNEYLLIQKNQNGIDIDYYCGQTLKEVKNLQTATANAIQQLQQMKSINTLISLSGYKISWSSNLKDIVVQGLGSNFAITLKTLIDDVNNQIINYENSLIAFKNLTGISNYIKTYISLIDDIFDICNNLVNEENILSRYSQLGEKCSLYLKNVYSVVSYKDINKVLDSIYALLLNGVFNKDNGVLVLSDSTLNEFLETENRCQKEIAEIEKTIDFYERLLTYIINRGNNPTIVHIRPIVLYFNRYEMSNINAWDGNKIETGDGSYLLAPQAGAGIKESDNSFTGIVMGQRNVTSSSKAGHNGQVGLFGYSKGEQTLLLNADNGSAIFGKSGSGQIIIDPEGKGYLYSSNYFKNYNSRTGLPTSYSNANVNNKGMLIDLNTPEIKFGSGNFSVNSNGYLTAKGGGSIAGWSIGDTTLKSNNNAITLDSSNSSIVFGTSSGKIYSGNHNSYTSTSDGFYLDYQGLSIGSKLKASKDGVLELGKLNGNHWMIDGGDSASYIKYGTQGRGKSVYIGTDKITLGTKFQIDNDGNMSGGSTNNWSINSAGTATFNNLIANSTGSIGGWTIGSTYLRGGTLTLSNSGAITGSNWNIAADGTASFRNVTTFTDTANFTNTATFKGSSGNVAAFDTSGFSVYTGSLGSSDNSVSRSGGVSVGKGSVGGNSVSAKSLGLNTNNFKIDDEDPVTYIKNLAVDSLNVSKELSFNGYTCKWDLIKLMTDFKMNWTYTTNSQNYITSVDFDNKSTDSVSVSGIVTSITHATKYFKNYYLLTGTYGSSSGSAKGD